MKDLHAGDIMTYPKRTSQCTQNDGSIIKVGVTNNRALQKKSKNSRAY